MFLNTYEVNVKILTKTPDKKKLENVILKIIAELGFSAFDFSVVKKLPTVKLRRMLGSSFESKFDQYYNTKYLSGHNLIIEYVLCNSEPVFHSKLYAAISNFPYEIRIRANTQQFQSELKAAGYSDAVIVPIHNQDDQAALFLVLKMGTHPVDFQHNSDHVLEKLSILGRVIYENKLLSQGIHKNSKKNTLTHQEIRVLQAFEKFGLLPGVVARKLNISERTIDKHTEHIRQKLDLHTTLDAVLYALKSEVIQLSEIQDNEEEQTVKNESV